MVELDGPTWLCEYAHCGNVQRRRLSRLETVLDRLRAPCCASAPSASSLRIAIDEMGHVVDVLSLGPHDEVLGLQIQRRVSITYQFERISPTLARGLARRPA